MGNGLDSIQSQKAFDMTPEIVLAAENVARGFGVSPLLVEYDQLLGFLVKIGGDGASAATNYIVGGHSDALLFAELVKDLKIPDKGSVLEFAAGFGRISRHLPSLIPHVKLSASDIHVEACRFLQDSLGIHTYASRTRPEELNVGSEHQLIAVVSLFSHLPEATFGRWLIALYRHLAPGGYLMFTTHGYTAVQSNPSFWNNVPEGKRPGHRFAPQSDQLDLEHFRLNRSRNLQP